MPWCAFHAKQGVGANVFLLFSPSRRRCKWGSRYKWISSDFSKGVSTNGGSQCKRGWTKWGLLFDVVVVILAQSSRATANMASRFVYPCSSTAQIYANTHVYTYVYICGSHIPLRTCLFRNTLYNCHILLSSQGGGGGPLFFVGSFLVISVISCRVGLGLKG